MKEEMPNYEKIESIDNENDVDEEMYDNDLTAYDIAVFYNTYNLSTLLKWWGTKLVVPDFQRSYVWNLKKASEFVDTMLRGLPVPSMFFYDDRDYSRLLVVDGQQRLYSLYCYICEGFFNGKEFKLKGNIHPKWNGKTYNELDELDQNRLQDALMNITVMRQLSPDDEQSSMYLAFQRINTGGMTLNAQEIRMAVSYGPFAKLIDKLSLDPRFDKWSFLRTESQIQNNNYSKIQELILKYWTYYYSYPKFSGTSTRIMIDNFFSEQRYFDNPKKRVQGVCYHSQVDFERIFNSTIEIMMSLDTDLLKPFSKPAQTFIEAIWVGLTYRKLVLNKKINVSNLPNYIKEWKNNIGEKDFSNLFQARRTSSVKSAYDRIKAGIDYFSGNF